ncbi:MAG: hypothetical protein J3K34DRAFT_499137 [Monoraphidium minutum]|nr:MAG: hypothetical protein J3K34DRAFT_499137 [Monoraphidium minutum]
MASIGAGLAAVLAHADDAALIAAAAAALAAVAALQDEGLPQGERTGAAQQAGHTCTLLNFLLGEAPGGGGFSDALAAPARGIVDGLARIMARSEDGGLRDSAQLVLSGMASTSRSRNDSDMARTILSHEGGIASLMQVVRPEAGDGGRRAAAAAAVRTPGALEGLAALLGAAQKAAADEALAALVRASPAPELQQLPGALRSPGAAVLGAAAMLGAPAAAEFAGALEVALAEHTRQAGKGDGAGARAAGRGAARPEQDAARQRQREQDQQEVAAGGGEAEAAGPPPLTCAACEVQQGPGKYFKLCGGCRSARYCSEACAKVAWKGGHRKECRLLQGQRVEAAAADCQAAGASAGTR